MRGEGREKAKIIERQINALELRKAGYTFREISKRLGISLGQAANDVNGEIQRLVDIKDSSAAELRQMELERVDRAIRGIMPFVEAGSAPHVMAFVKCIEQRAKLLGLYAPEQLNVKLEWRTQAIEDIRAGRIEYAALVEAFDESLATQLFREAGVTLPSG